MAGALRSVLVTRNDSTETPDERMRRIGVNEAFFRGMNERLQDLQQTWELGPESLDLVCECGDAACTERIRMSPDAYRGLRSDAALFAVVPGHEGRGVEEVVRRENGYYVVRKHPGEPERLARATEL